MSDIEKKTEQLKKKLRSAVLTKEWLERTIISLGLYGRVTGVLGPFIIANLHGKMIIRLRPKDFQMSQTEASIANRNNMAAANKFAMFLKSIDLIYKVWKAAKIEGNNPFTRLIKYNKMYLVNDCPSLNNIITPEGNAIYIENIITAEKNGKITISKDYCSNEKEKMIIVLIALNPKKKNCNDYECIELNSSTVTASQEIELKEWQKALCRNYKRFIVYTTVIRQDSKAIQWSNTCLTEGEFDFGSEYEKAEIIGYGQILNEPSIVSFQHKRILVKPPG